jgi:hypothetical protein
LGVRADPLHGCAASAHLLRTRSTSFGNFALYTHRQSYLCGAWLAARGQSRHLAGFRCPYERRAGVNLPGAPARICFDSRCRGCRASPPRRFRRRARRQTGRPGSGWARSPNASGPGVCRADNGSDSAKCGGHRSTTTGEKRARPTGNTSAARGARRRPDAVGCACARTAAVTAPAECRRFNSATGFRFAFGAAAEHDCANDYAYDNPIHDSVRR